MAVVEFVRPRVESVPVGDRSRGVEAVELYADVAGSPLDPWEAYALEQAMAVKDDGRFVPFEVGLVCPRQNGKDEILIARELAGLFLLGEELIIHSAHLFATSKEHQMRLWSLIEGNEEYSRKVKRQYLSHGDEGILLVDGRRIRFLTRMNQSARGFTVDCMIFNEAMILKEESRAAMMPTLATRPNPQLWYAGSAVDQRTHDHGVVFASVRERGLAGDDPALAYMEWSAETDRSPDDLGELAFDEAAIRQANPSLGVRIPLDHVEKERRSMAARTYAVERMGVGDWPRTDGLLGSVISPDQWAALFDSNSKLLMPVCMAYDVAPDRSYAAIAVAGYNQDGLLHVEVGEHRRGTHWVVERFVELLERFEPVWAGCDAYAMLPGMEAQPVRTVAAAEHGMACGRFVDAVQDGQLRHLGSDELRSAVLAARTRPLGDLGWAWSRKGSPVDITPLVASTLAVSAAIDNPVGGVQIW